MIYCVFSLRHRFVPESFRWYVGHDRLEDSTKVIERISRVNRTPIPDLSVFKQKTDNSDSDFASGSELEGTSSDKKYTFLDLVKQPNLLKLTLLFSFIWFVFLPSFLYFQMFQKLHQVESEINVRQRVPIFVFPKTKAVLLMNI